MKNYPEPATDAERIEYLRNLPPSRFDEVDITKWEAEAEPQNKQTIKSLWQTLAHRELDWDDGGSFYSR